MNTKRQTVWLVSMLSLMVILSAYYLFTEDVDTSSDMLTDGTQQEQQVQSDATEASTADTTLDNGITVTEVTGAANSDNAASAADEQAAGETADAVKTDEEVINEIEASGGAVSTVFNDMQEKRDEKFYSEINQLYGQISDTKQKPEEASAAVEQINLLEDKNTRITGIEEELTKEFSNAFVSEENNKYKVVVQSDKLEKSQADSIMMLVMNELEVGGDQVSVQYIPSNK
ncbi:SpoIIIAH-like family protein [Paenibacillus sepulcri]|uniref:SpoIIIAH-like family protein n=1 Tax=Paenibacillus sepulcri TaxID=359917 RepID=A0ABS7BZU3_9BACL|nr:SpoIIIAH-like family protein [Paenibacillus sepulcri]